MVCPLLVALNHCASPTYCFDVIVYKWFLDPLKSSNFIYFYSVAAIASALIPEI